MTEQEAKEVLDNADWRPEIIKLVRDHPYCEYCLLNAKNPVNFWRMTVDHIVPGEGDARDNLAQACGRCNSRKGNRLPPALSKEEFLGLNREQKVARIREWLEAAEKKKLKPTEQQQFEAFGVLWQK